jgi:ribosomal protein L37AE/L43A
MTDNERDVSEVVSGICPSCGEHSTFTYLGTQIWPEIIAKRLKIPERSELYLCDKCFSTISDRTLPKD